MCILFAATYPERTSALDHGRLFARSHAGARLPVGARPRQQLELPRRSRARLGRRRSGIDVRSPSLAHDERYRQWWARLLRLERQPGGALRR